MSRVITNKMDLYIVHHNLLIYLLFTSSSPILKFDQMYNVSCILWLMGII